MLFRSPIPYYDVAADTSASYIDGFSLTLEGYESVTYITKDDASLNLGPLPTLPYGAVYTSTEQGEELPDASVLSAPWPNPTRGQAMVTWSIDRSESVRLELFDMLGRRVWILEDGIHTAGFHESRIDAATLGPGVYRLRLQAGERVATRSLVVVR